TRHLLHFFCSHAPSPSLISPLSLHDALPILSPLASALGGKAAKRGNGTTWPPSCSSPTTGSSARSSLPRASSASHSATKAVRSTRWGAFGHPYPKRMVRTVSSSPASKIGRAHV